MIRIHLKETKGYPGFESCGFEPSLWMADGFAFALASVDRRFNDCVEYWLIGVLMVARSTKDDLTSWGIREGEFDRTWADVTEAARILEQRGIDASKLLDILRQKVRESPKEGFDEVLRDRNRCWAIATERANARGESHLWAQDLLPVLLACPSEPIQQSLAQYRQT